MSWSLYRHTSPSGKVYVGITSNITKRWASKGYYYQLSNTIFSRAIRKYGWDNFLHEVIASNLPESTAKALEIEFIALYKKLGLSYNMTNGGEGYKGVHEFDHIRNRVESRISNNKTIVLVIDKNFNYKVFRSKSEAGSYLGVNQRVVSHVLSEPLGYTCKDNYLWEQSKYDDVDIDSIRNSILKAISDRKKFIRENRLKSKKMNKYDEP